VKLNSARNSYVPALLDKRLWFPDPELAADSGSWNGLVAIGGDLSVPRLLLAYRSGIFPWTINPITWWSPHPRAILEPDALHISRSLARVVRKGVFQITRDKAFAAVMESCAAPVPGREETWISREFILAYTELHRRGHAHSLECWQGGQLVGGIYGVSIGAFFAGESMFHRASNASKVALVHLSRHLRERGFTLFDVQIATPITATLGAMNIPRAEYLKRVHEAVKQDCLF
jgi:leucyl/phenylalanyl-tRNA--protein transferase